MKNPKEEPKQEIQHLLSTKANKERLYEELKQETLEDFAERIARAFDNDNYKAIMELVIESAKWQEQRMYSEEDMKQAFNDGSNTLIYDEINYKSEFKRKMNEWLEEYKRLEQFKKK